MQRIELRVFVALVCDLLPETLPLLGYFIDSFGIELRSCDDVVAITLRRVTMMFPTYSTDDLVGIAAESKARGATATGTRGRHRFM